MGIHGIFDSEAQAAYLSKTCELYFESAGVLNIISVPTDQPIRWCKSMVVVDPGALSNVLKSLKSLQAVPYRHLVAQLEVF